MLVLSKKTSSSRLKRDSRDMNLMRVRSMNSKGETQNCQLKLGSKHFYVSLSLSLVILLNHNCGNLIEYIKFIIDRIVGIL